MSAVTPEHAVEVLNRIHAADPSVLPYLIGYRVSCNDALADDPTVQVGKAERPSGEIYWEVGLLGVLNGIFGVQSEKPVGYIVARFERGTLLGFEVNRDFS